MVRSLGIHLQPDGCSYALLEGSAKKWSVSAHGSVGLAPGAPPKEALAAALGTALKSAVHGKVDQLVLSLSSVDVVLRELNLPFAERDKIHQVLKFEIESDLYHLDIDDVVCDYIELHEERATTTLLVAALPKTQLAAGLEILSEVGQDPPVVDLDLGSLAVATAAVRPPPGSTAEDGESTSGLEGFLHLGPYASQLLVRDGVGLRAARAIHLGWRELARGLEVEPEPVAPGEDSGEEPQSGEEPLSAGESKEVDSASPGPPLFGADPDLPRSLDLEEVLERCPVEQRQAFEKRLIAEVRRGLAVLASSPIAHLHLLGAELPGLAEACRVRLGVPAAPLAPNEEGVDPVALGAALRGLGLGGSEMNFRQEEYRYATGLERLEGPLTLMLVGLIAFFLVDAVVHFQKSRVLQADCERIFQAAVQQVDGLNQQLREEDPKKWFIKTDFQGLDLADTERMGALSARVRRAKKDLDEMLGEGSVPQPQSCLEAWRLLNEVLKRELEENYSDRWMLETLDLKSVEARRKGSESHVEARINVTIFGDVATSTRKFEDLKSAFQAQPWVSGEVTSQSGFKATDVAGARTGQIVVPISVSKARELGL